MFRKIPLFKNLIDNIPKNAGLYMVGVILIPGAHIDYDPIQVSLGLFSFLVSYSSIYVMNDLFDITEDRESGEKTERKPLAKGTVKRSEAFAISGILLAIGILFTLLLNLLFLGVTCILVLANILYSAPPLRLKHGVFGLPLVLIMQLLKILLPWTLTTGLIQFPILFVLGFSVIYLIIFQGYKEQKTIGESVRDESLLFGLSIVMFLASVLLYPGPSFQIFIVCYLLAGLVFFRNSHLIDRRVLVLSPVYVLAGIIMFFLILVYL
jgi:4-hydroxybenzoate polyprenyltransferase